MCCVFTCCGWMIDFIMRVWTFAMSCCISSAICCLLISASLAGIAMGYNYSLAEYIDLKETNVSVYLKRGVFDDEIADDLEWRRSGHLPVDGHINDENLITEAPEGGDLSLRSGRRLDDSVIESGGVHNKFEGSLMRLTAQPLHGPITSSTFPPISRGELEELPTFREGSADALKAVQQLLNKRRQDFTSTVTPPSIGRRVNDETSQHTPEHPTHHRTPMIWPDVVSGRRFNPYDPSHASIVMDKLVTPDATPIERVAVPERSFWKSNYLATSTRGRGGIDFLYEAIFPISAPTHPTPITLNWAPIRPPTERPHTPSNTIKAKVITIERIPDVEAAKSADEFDKIGQSLGGGDLEKLRQRVDNRIPAGDDDYDMDPKGIPSRKKRRTVNVPNMFGTESGRKTQDNNMDGKGFPNRYKREIFTSSSTVLSFTDKLGNDESKEHVKEIPNRKKRHIMSSSSNITSTLGKLSKSSDVYRTETMPKIYKKYWDAKKITKGVNKEFVSSSNTILSTLDKLSKSSDEFLSEIGPKVYESNIDAKEVPSRRKIYIVSSSSLPNLDKLSKSSDMFRTETVPRIYESNKDVKEIPSTEKIHIVSSSSNIPSTLGKLSKSSDLFRTETLPRIYESNKDVKEIPSTEKIHIVSSSSNIPSTLGKLSKSSDVFRTETVPKIYKNDLDTKIITKRANKQFVSSSNTILSTLSKLSKSSDVFSTETVPKIYESNKDSKEIPSSKKKRVVSSSTFSTIFSNLHKSNKSSDEFRNEYTPKIYENNINAKEISRKRKIHAVSSSSNNPHTLGNLRKSSDVFRTETVPKLHENNMDAKLISKRVNKQFVSSSNTILHTLDKLSKYSDAFHTESVSQQDPRRQKNVIVSSFTSFPVILDEPNESPDVFKIENLLEIDKNNENDLKIDIRKTSKNYLSSLHPTTRGKLTSDKFSSEIMNKIHNTILIDKLLSTLIGIN